MLYHACNRLDKFYHISTIWYNSTLNCQHCTLVLADVWLLTVCCNVLDNSEIDFVAPFVLVLIYQRPFVLSR